MIALAPLSLSVPDTTLCPDNAAFMARTDLEQTRMLGYTPFNLDAVTTFLLGLLGNRATVRHICGTTDEILRFLTEAGLSITEDMHRYENGAEAETIADRLVSEGKKLFWPYPLRAGRFTDAAHLVPPALWASLNSKTTLPDLVPSDALAPRRQYATEALAHGVELPAYIKAGGTEATGWGYAVQYCETAEQVAKAQAEFADKSIDTVISEAAMPVLRCWCVNLAVMADGVHVLGAAEQTFSAPARQLGSVIDPDHLFPTEGHALALTVAEAARKRGFLGVCGLDIGQTPEGRFIVFDPNFRFNSSTPQVLLHPAATARSGLKLSQSFGGKTNSSVTALIDRVKGPVEDGWFVPTRLIDGSLLPAAEGISHCTGFVLADTRAEAETRSRLLQSLIDS
ncbi:hypothetical protein [Celeribacter sp. ULVN23_4]